MVYQVVTKIRAVYGARSVVTVFAEAVALLMSSDTVIQSTRRTPYSYFNAVVRWYYGHQYSESGSRYSGPR